MQKAIKRYFPVFVLPTLIAFTIGFLAPFVLGVYLSFCKFTTVTDAKFIGLSNYAKILGDGDFLHSLWFTALFTIVTVLLINIFAFAVAMLLTKNIKGTNISVLYFYAEPDRWYCTWLYLADIAEWSAFQVGTATAFTFSKKWFYRYAHSAYVAADWIYDDHLHCRSEQCIT